MVQNSKQMRKLHFQNLCIEKSCISCLAVSSKSLQNPFMHM